MRRAAAGALLLLSLGGLGCDRSTPTGIVVEVTSPMAIPDVIDRLELRVVGTDSGEMIDQAFDLTDDWPHSVAVLPGADRSESVTITVTAMKRASDGDPLFVARRVLQATFVPGQTRTVSVVLPNDCRGVECTEGVDCEGGRCVDGPATDGGQGMDAGMDGGGDAGGEADAAVQDAMAPDAPSCSSAEECVDAVDCTTDACESGGCVHTPDDSACAAGELCQPARGCEVPCSVDSDCDDGAPCNGAEVCESGRCLVGTPLACDDGLSCTSDECDDAAGGCAFVPDDALCSDANACNGTETCEVTVGCTAGAAPDCDDAKDCTTDACAPATGCTHRTRDLDGDGYGDETCMAAGGVPATDCDDADPNANPGAPELCNGRDDNCDGSADETFTCAASSTEACMTGCGTTGTRICSATCSWSICSPPAEVCNGVDDDCNGGCDDGLGCCAGTTGPCMTSCGSTGTRTCSGTCSWGSCAPPAETCNGVNDDCDAFVDEGCGSCTDGVQNGLETDVDCGGAGSCPRCPAGAMCGSGSDCATLLCSGGVCISCTDGVQNGSETDVDCGGGLCPACSDGSTCSVGTDCQSGVCSGGTCAAPSCTDGLHNGTETDVDCGGPCAPCPDGDGCSVADDCESGVCTSGTCAVGTCTDGVHNGGETDVDCGGETSCPRCPDGANCTAGTDCVAGICSSGFCGDCVPFGSDTFGYTGCTRPGGTPCPDIATNPNRLSLTDDSHSVQAMGFSFDFYGTAHTDVTVGSNGLLYFTGGSHSFSNSCLPSTGTPSAFIAAFWDDLNPSSNPGEVYVAQRGTAPNRTFVVQWVLQHFNSTPETIDVRAVLTEGTNTITLCYVDTTFGNASYDDGISATVGIQGSTTDYIEYSCNTATVTAGTTIEFRR